MSAQTPESEVETINRLYLRPDVKPDCVVMQFDFDFAVKVCRNETTIQTKFGRYYVVKDGSRQTLGISPDLIVDAERYEAAYEAAVEAWKHGLQNMETASEVTALAALRMLGILVNSKPMAIVVSQS